MPCEGIRIKAAPLVPIKSNIQDLCLVNARFAKYSKADVLIEKRSRKKKKDISLINFLVLTSNLEICFDGRCLEGGAEEFFLKPIQLSHMVKLKPFLQKGKLKDHQPSPEQEEHTTISSSSSSSSSNNSGRNKRKAMDDDDDDEDGVLPEKTRPRLSTAESSPIRVI